MIATTLILLAMLAPTQEQAKGIQNGATFGLRGTESGPTYLRQRRDWAILVPAASVPRTLPGPETPTGKTVRPTVSYTYATWSTDGRPMIVRVPLTGQRKATLRTGGVMGA